MLLYKKYSKRFIIELLVYNNTDYIDILDIIDLSFIIFNSAFDIISIEADLSYHRNQSVIIDLQSEANSRHQEEHLKHKESSLDNVKAEAAIIKINARFKEESIGYAYEKNLPGMIKLDSQYLHKEAVKPVLTLLSEPLFHHVHQDFREAYKANMEHRPKDVMTACLRAFDSMIKAICSDMGWIYHEKDTAKRLLHVLRVEQFFPQRENSIIYCLKLWSVVYQHSEIRMVVMAKVLIKPLISPIIWSISPSISPPAIFFLVRPGKKKRGRRFRLPLLPSHHKDGLPGSRIIRITLGPILGAVPGGHVIICQRQVFLQAFHKIRIADKATTKADRIRTA